LKDQVISITGLGSVSALGMGADAVWASYKDPKHLLTQKVIKGDAIWVGACAESVTLSLHQLEKSIPAYRELDESVLLAILAGRLAVQSAGWEPNKTIGINIGSSRGATALFEKHYGEFMDSNSTHPLTSPNTTLGNISFWVAQDLGSNGPNFSHSITCSTAMHALLNGVAWLRAGMSEYFLVGGSEAALTPFTIAQLQALRIYSRETKEYPSRAMDLQKSQNAMVLGSGAAVACLELGKSPKAWAYIKGLGYATERIAHPASLSANAQCIQDAMRMAIAGVPVTEIDVVVLHAPGTKKGDQAEMAAVQAVFGSHIPALTGNKWKIGHTFGASGMFSIEMALHMLLNQEFISHPFAMGTSPMRMKYILVNAIGFGGNAVSVLLERAHFRP
jgi:3-oxoacyl-(acyl-carrier-protein) synthase